MHPLPDGLSTLHALALVAAGLLAAGLLHMASRRLDHGLPPRARALRRLMGGSPASRFLMLFDAAPDGILIMDSSGVILLINAQIERMLGFGSEELIGGHFEHLIPEALRERHRDYERAYVAHRPERPMSNNPSLVARHKNGTIIPVDISLSYLRADKGDLLMAFLRDVSERRSLEIRLRHQATHDALTGLPNRILFMERLRAAIPAARRRERLGSVVLLDLDNFKTVNDGFGHSFGDRLLVELAARLRSVLRPEDVIARLGGDEFVVLLEDLATEQDAVTSVERLATVLAEPFEIQGCEIVANASFGCTLFPGDATDPEELLRNADLAMYKSKGCGRNVTSFFSAELNRRVREDLEIQAQLRKAIDEQLLVLHYQPQAHVDTEAIRGVEALLRWEDPRLGRVDPARFIAVAEACGLIGAIGNWVIDTACRQIVAWSHAGAPTRIAVNVSALQLRQPDFRQRVCAALESSGASPALLELEITESALIERPAESARLLEDLASIGVRIAIDDFGTGYSSLGQLKSLPLHTLKIDRSFVRDMLVDDNDRFIVSMLINLAHQLGMQAVAEGVETEDQRQALLVMGCDQYQGWLFAPALPATGCEPLLQRGCPRPQGESGGAVAKSSAA